MSAQEFKAAYDAGRAAHKAKQPTRANPYQPSAPAHPLAESPGPKAMLLAQMWLRGWHKEMNQPKAAT